MLISNKAGSAMFLFLPFGGFLLFGHMSKNVLLGPYPIILKLLWKS